MITLTASGVLAIPFLLVGGILAFFKKSKRRGIIKWTGILYVTSLAILLFAVTPFLMASLLTRAGSRPQESADLRTPADWSLPFEEIEFESNDGIRLRGWFIPPRGKQTVITYSHGLFRSRYEVLERAARLSQLGYGSVLYDARHHGRSEPGNVTMGYFERHDVLGALQWIRKRQPTNVPKVVLMGISMGAAAVLMAAAETEAYDAIVADSPFLNLEDTVARHAWMFLGMPRFPFVPLLMTFYSRRAGFDPSDFDLLDVTHKLKECPVLMIHGAADNRIPIADGRRLFDALASRQKEFHAVDEATHGAGYRTAPEEYLEVVARFLSRHIE